MLITYDKFDKALEYLKDTELCAVDTETYWIDQYHLRKIIGVSVYFQTNGDKFFGFYFPFRHGSVGGLPVENLSITDELPRLTETLNTIPKHIYHNAKFDRSRFALEGLELTSSFYCTMLMSHMWDENGSHKLEDLAERFGIDPEANARQKELHKLRHKIGWHRIPLDKMGEYAVGDTRNTYRLFPRLQAFLEKQELWNLWPDMEEYSDVMMQMELRGIGINPDLAYELSKSALERMSAIKDELRFDPGKPLELATRLFTELGLPILAVGKPSKQFPKGRPTMDEDAITELGKRCLDDPTVQLVLEYRGLQKARSTWYDGWLELMDSKYRLHPSFNIIGTVSTRRSSSDPNVQQIPRDIDSCPVKKLLTPTEGYELWEFDYCVHPDTRILGTNLRWYKAFDLSVGQKLIGFDEEPAIGHNQRGQRLRETKVMSIKKVLQPSFRITTTKGTVTSSGLHKWMASREGSAYSNWIQTNNLSPGDKLSWYCSPWEVEDTYTAGWLAGIFDGEGHCSGTAVGFGQNDGDLIQTVLCELQERDFSYNISSSGRMNKIYIQGGVGESMRLLGTIRPQRLLEKSYQLWEGRRTWGKLNSPATILKIEYLGEGEVLAIGTSTKTFIAEGFLSHNSQLEYRIGASYADERSIINAYEQGSDFHTLTANVLGISRQLAKTVNFCILYGGGAGKVAEVIGSDISTGREFLERIKRTYPRLFEIADRVNAKAAKLGYIKLWTGRRCHFARFYETKKAFNRLIQGGGAEITKQATLNLARDKSLPIHMISEVHDALWIEIPKGESGNLIPRIIYHMEFPTRLEFFKVPFTVEYKCLSW